MISRFFIISYWCVLMYYNFVNYMATKNKIIALLATICFATIVSLVIEGA